MLVVHRVGCKMPRRQEEGAPQQPVCTFLEANYQESLSSSSESSGTALHVSCLMHGVQTDLHFLLPSLQPRQGTQVVRYTTSFYKVPADERGKCNAAMLPLYR